MEQPKPKRVATLRHRPKFKSELGWFVYDSLTSPVGTYDPARIFGYFGAALTGLAFLGLSIYDSIANKHFDYNGFAAGLAAVSATIVGAAAGVRIKGTNEPTDASTVYEDVRPGGKRRSDPPADPQEEAAPAPAADGGDKN